MRSISSARVHAVHVKAFSKLWSKVSQHNNSTLWHRSMSRECASPKGMRCGMRCWMSLMWSNIKSGVWVSYAQTGLRVGDRQALTYRSLRGVDYGSCWSGVNRRRRDVEPSICTSFNHVTHIRFSLLPCSLCTSSMCHSNELSKIQNPNSKLLNL